MTYNVHDIADKVILRTDMEKGDLLSNLKLQKLLYFLQGYHLAFFDELLFEDHLEAWAYGPVVPVVYHRFKDLGTNAILLDPKMHREIRLSDEEEDMFNQVMEEYGKFSATKLMDMTHRDTPWKEGSEKADKVISHEIMKDFFVEFVED